LDAVGIRDVLLSTEKRFYCLCFSCRSGSTLLANDLMRSGLGAPFEYFHVEEQAEANDRPLELEQKVDDRPLAQRIWELVDSSEGGVFGFKIALNQLHWLTQRLRREGDLSVTDDLRTVFPRLRFVTIRRTDKVGQAVSYWRALMTDQWHDDARTSPSPLRRPDYDFEAIRETLLAVVTEDWLWDAYFDANGIECHHVVYEQYNRSRVSNLEAIFDFLGVARPPVVPVVDGTNVMRDDWSEEVVKRVWDDLAAQAFRGLKRSDAASGPALAASGGDIDFLGHVASIRKPMV
jgi:trehalose 2-sulfotransferase